MSSRLPVRPPHRPMSSIEERESTVDSQWAHAPRPALERGACVDRYLIVDELGQGGMGVVYKAFDPELGRPIALKLLNTRSDASDVLRGRLLREAQALARLSHPNVIAVHDVGTFDDDVFIAMEFVDGTVAAPLAQEPPARSQREILDVFLAAGEGLRAAHRAGLVHRDFKPDNVIVGCDGRVRVLDFGLARTAIGDEEATAASRRRAAADATPTWTRGPARTPTRCDGADAAATTARAAAPTARSRRVDGADRAGSERADVAVPRRSATRGRPCMAAVLSSLGSSSSEPRRRAAAASAASIGCART